MAGHFALGAEIFGRLHQPHAEKLLPEPVDRNSGREGVIGPHEPLGQPEPVARGSLGQGREHRRHVRLDLLIFIGPVVLAAQQHVGFARLGQVGHDQRGGYGIFEFLNLLLQPLPLFPQRLELLAGGYAHFLQKMAPQPGQLLLGAFFGRGVDDFFQLLGQSGSSGPLGHSQPAPEGEETALVAGVRAAHARVVPVHRAAELGEGPAVHFGPGLQPHGFGRHFQADPLARRGQGPHGPATGRLVAPPLNPVLAPVGPMLPIAAVELEHNLVGLVFRVQIDVGEQHVAFANHQRRIGPQEKVLAQFFGFAHGGLLAGVDRMLGLGNPLPALGSFVPLGVGSGGQLFVNPDFVHPGQFFGRGVLQRVLVIQPGQGLLVSLLGLFELLAQLGQLGLLFGGGDFHRRRRQRGVAVQPAVRRAVEKGVKLIELALADRVVLVLVAHRAADCHAQENRADRLGAVHGVPHPELFLDYAPFAGGDVAPQETGGNPLFPGGVGQQVACNLLDGELVERHVGVEGPNDPVPIRPDGTIVIQVQPVGVAVSGRIEPVPGHVFPVMGRSQQAVHQAPVSPGPPVGQKAVHFFQRGRQAGQVQAQAADERLPRSFRGRLQPFPFQTSPDEQINRVPHSLAVLHLRQWRAFGRHERPMVFPGGSLFYPAANQVRFGLGERLAASLGRHPQVFILGDDSLVEEALLRLARHHHGLAVLARFENPFADVQPQLGFASVGIRPVALETPVRKQRANLRGKVHRSGGLLLGLGTRDRAAQQHPHQTGPKQNPQVTTQPATHDPDSYQAG